MPGMEGTMHEFKHGTLKSGSGQTVRSRDQAIAIGISQEKKMKSYEKGGRVPETGPAKVHKGEVILPSRKMEPPTPGDSEMSDDHLHDSVAFNTRHAVDHIGQGMRAEQKLAERGVSPRTGTMRDVINRAFDMPLDYREGPFADAEDAGAKPLSAASESRGQGSDPVTLRKAMQRSRATSAVKAVAKGDVPNMTKGASATHKFAKKGKK